MAHAQMSKGIFMELNKWTQIGYILKMLAFKWQSKTTWSLNGTRTRKSPKRVAKPQSIKWCTQEIQILSEKMDILNKTPSGLPGPILDHFYSSHLEATSLRRPAWERTEGFAGCGPIAMPCVQTPMKPLFCLLISLPTCFSPRVASWVS